MRLFLQLQNMALEVILAYLLNILSSGILNFLLLFSIFFLKMSQAQLARHSRLTALFQHRRIL